MFVETPNDLWQIRNLQVSFASGTYSRTNSSCTLPMNSTKIKLSDSTLLRSSSKKANQPAINWDRDIPLQLKLSRSSPSALLTFDRSSNYHGIKFCLKDMQALATWIGRCERIKAWWHWLHAPFRESPLIRCRDAPCRGFSICDSNSSRYVFQILDQV